MSHYARGAAREREVMALLKERGWRCFRGAGSKGCDIVALREGHTPRLYEVKATAAGPFSGFGPADRDAMRALAREAGAVAFLCWWPPDRRGPRWIPEEGWP